MDETDNSDIMKRTLYSLVTVAITKTSDDYAWSTIKKLLNELKNDYDFLKYVQIGELEDLDNNIDDISIISHMNTIEKKELGKAIQT